METLRPVSACTYTRPHGTQPHPSPLIRRESREPPLPNDEGSLKLWFPIGGREKVLSPYGGPTDCHGTTRTVNLPW